MTKRLQPIRLDAYKPLSEVVSETLRSAIRTAPSTGRSASWKFLSPKNSV